MTATPGPDLQAMVAPGQEDLIDGFLQELEQEQQELAQAGDDDEAGGEQLLAGKFKSVEELERSYQELQRMVGQRGQQQGDQPPAEEQPALTPDQYTPELGKELYGDTVATAIEAAAINPLEMAEKVYAGEDVSSYVDALVDKGGLPRDLVETYLQGVAPAKANVPATPDSSAGLTEADVAELKGMVGGDEQFQQLSQWAMANLEPQELADYNAAVDSGNKAAARFALKQLQVRAAASSGQEPKLIGGGSAIKADVFESDQQAVDARSKRDKSGRFLYEIDPKYRQWYDKTLARSNVFL